MAYSKRGKKKEETVDERLTKVVGYYETAAESTQESREQSELARDMYDGFQATAEEEATLKARGQTVTIRNRIKPKIDSLKGLEQQGRTDPRANPRTPMDDQAANACTDSIRFVCDDEDFSQKRTEVFDNVLIEGSGGAIVEVNAKTDILIRYIPWDRMFADPHSRLKDYRDARYKGIVVWLDEDEAKAIYKDKAEDVLAGSWSAYNDSNTYDDKPAHQRWVDGKRKRVKVCEIYYKEAGVWTYCVFTKSGFLAEPQPSSYVNEDGEPECPIEYISCHVDRENNRYGLVRQLIGPQVELNHRAWKALHRMTQQQTLAERGAVDNIQKWKKEQAKPNGFMEYNPGLKVEIKDNQQLTVFEMQMLEEAKREIDSVGANADMQGKGDAGASGVALREKRAAGVTETGSAFDSLHIWNRNVYIQIWHRIKQYWTAEKWVRVTDDERNTKFVGLNIAGPDGQKQNDVSRMDVDIELDDVPDVATAQQADFAMLAEAYKANPQTPINPMGIPFRIVVKASALRDKQEILDIMSGVQPGQPMNGQQPQGAQPNGQPPQLGPDGQPMQPPSPEQMIGQIMEQAAMQLQQIGQQIAQGVQQAGEQAVGAIQQAGQQAAQGVQMAGHEAVIATQGAAAQSVAQVTGNAAANGIQAMMAGMNQPKPAMQVLRDQNQRISVIAPLNG